MLDIHSHILPGLDDGVPDLPASVELAKEAVAAGVEVMAATPHVRTDYPTSAAQVTEGVRTVAAELATHGVPLTVVSGAEVALDWVPRILDDDLRTYTLAASGRYLLVEFPYVGWPRAAGLVLDELARRGVTAVLAHPERNDAVQESPSRLRALVEATGALVQVTVGSLNGSFGSRARSTALTVVSLGLGHVAASDAHQPGGSRRMWATPAEISPVLAEWMTVTVPRAILSGHEIPPRPQVGGRLARAGRRLLRGFPYTLSDRTQPPPAESR